MEEDQAIINYWFGHVWEIARPIYPGIILTVALVIIPIATLISKTWPGVLAMFGFGSLFLLTSTVFRVTDHVQFGNGFEQNISKIVH